MKPKSEDPSVLPPIEPSNKQLINCVLLGWEYDKESMLLYREDKIGYFTQSGFYVL